MPEHHDSEEFDVSRRPEGIVASRLAGVVVVVVVGGGEDEEAKFPNGGGFDIVASGEESECPLGEKEITALY